MSGAPKASDVPGTIKYLLRQMIQSADLQTLVHDKCKQHLREQFCSCKFCSLQNCQECVLGEAVLVKHTHLIKDTINHEVEVRVRDEAREQWTKRHETNIAWHENPDLQPQKRLYGLPTAVRAKKSKQQLQAEARQEKERLELEAQLKVDPKLNPEP